LYDPDQTLIDTVTYEAQLPDVSFGRQPDGNASWFYFGEPSPAGPNNTGGIPGKAIAVVPQFSLPGGFYQGSQTVELSAVSPGAVIRYTLDGSIPGPGSTLYSAPLNVSSTTVIRARSFETGYLPSPVMVQTYFIDQDFTLPVISIATEPANLWDDEIGIYVEGTNGIPGNGSDTPKNWNRDWERPINLEFYESDGNPGFNMQAGVKIFGGFTRKKPQKSLAIYARDRYGSDTVDYQLFADKSIDEFKTFLLRSSGNGQKTMFRDAMMHTLVKHLDIDLQAYRPAIVFLNGDYWGIHNIREKLNEHYLDSNHDVDPNNVDLLEKYGKVHAGDADHYEALLDFVETNDMTLPQNYEYIRTQMEVDEYLTYQIAELYYANTDWPDNNIKFWRPKTATGRWRWLLYDTDFGFQMAKIDRDKIPVETDDEEATILLRNLLENPDFQNDFIQRFASHINITFQPDRVISIIDELRANIAAEMPGHIDKWDEPSSMDKWEEEIEEELREFARQRPAHVRQHILDRFGLSGTVNLTLNFESEQGKILVSAVEAPATNFTGIYFKDVPLQLKAVPKPGYRFANWQGAGGAVDPTADTIWITLTADTTITALFEEVIIEDNDPLVINEIHYNPAAAQGSDDDYEFVELYNRSGSPVDLAGYAFTDGIVFTFTTGSTLAAGEHIVVAKNAATYSGQGYPVFQWSSGNLSNGGETLELRNSVGNIADVVPYDDLSPWPEEPDGTGPSLELIDPVLDNALPANWKPSNEDGGTPGQANTTVISGPVTYTYLPLITRNN